MENEIIRRADSAPARDIGVITAEIKSIRQQANALALLYAVEIGRRLEEAKRALAYGEWGDWLKNEVDFSQSTANNFMRLYEEYGSSQISIFGASVDSQTFANLPYSKALQLLAVPREEREAFAEEVGAEDLSVKELRAAIEERDRARAEKEDLERKLEVAEAAKENAELKSRTAEEYEKRLADMEATAAKEKEKADALREKLRRAEADPKIPKEKLDRIRAEAEAAASEKNRKALDEAKKKAEDTEAEAARARIAAEQAKRELDDAEKKLKTASPDVAAFKALFDQIQRLASRLREMIDTIRAGDPETADKLSAAMKAFGAKL